MAKVEDKNARFKRMFPAVLLWILAAAIYGSSTYYVLHFGFTWADEVTFLIKSHWYVSGAVTPYTSVDATWFMPLYFYQLGFWQDLAGTGITSSRAMSIVFGALSALILFSICRRLTANTTAASAAVFIFVATPATTYFFATATPAATISTVHLAAVWLIITGLGRPRLWATIAMGIICTALFFYSQSMILSILVLAPLYMLAIGKRRWLNGIFLIATMAGSTAALLWIFPEKLIQYALRLPSVAPILERFGWAPPNFTIIDSGTMNALSMDIALNELSLTGIIDGFLLPYVGTILFALLLFKLGVKGLRILWISTFYFFWLAATHYIGLSGQCDACMHSYVPHFAAIGALAAALTLAMMAHWARQNGVPPSTLTIACALIVVAGNTFASGLAFSNDYRLFPLARVSVDSSTTETKQIEKLAQWIASHTSPDEPILPIHSLGSKRLPSLPYAVFLAGHTMPIQSIDLSASYRTIKQNLSGPAREAVQGALDEESLWTEATMQRWLNRDYDLVLFQADPTIDQSNRLITITAHFNHLATTDFQGSNIYLFERRPTQ